MPKCLPQIVQFKENEEFFVVVVVVLIHKCLCNKFSSEY